jgi:hypothetical protein
MKVRIKFNSKRALPSLLLTVAGMDLMKSIQLFSEGSYFYASACILLFLWLSNRANKHLDETEKEIELDSYLEGYKHGIKSTQGGF